MRQLVLFGTAIARCTRQSKCNSAVLKHKMLIFSDTFYVVFLQCANQIVAISKTFLYICNHISFIITYRVSPHECLRDLFFAPTPFRNRFSVTLYCSQQKIRKLAASPLFYIGIIYHSQGGFGIRGVRCVFFAIFQHFSKISLLV